MKTILKLSMALVLTLSALELSVPAALAAPPSNDTSANATLINPFDFNEIVDTTEATTDANDTQLNATCGEPATDASVWYVMQGIDYEVYVDVSNSDYSAVAIVGVGTPGDLTTVACGQIAIFTATPGTTYYILVVDNQTDGGGNGGNLSIFTNVQPLPTGFDFQINPFGTFNGRTGVATISGTYTCSRAFYVGIDMDASQTVGQTVIVGVGHFFARDTCDGTSHDWSIDIYPQDGKFVGGKLKAEIFAHACGESIPCARSFVQMQVRLRGHK